MSNLKLHTTTCPFSVFFLTLKKLKFFVTSFTWVHLSFKNAVYTSCELCIRFRGMIDLFRSGYYKNIHLHFLRFMYDTQKGVSYFFFSFCETSAKNTSAPFCVRTFNRKKYRRIFTVFKFQEIDLSV